MPFLDIGAGSIRKIFTLLFDLSLGSSPLTLTKGHRAMKIDWEFELEIAQSKVSSLIEIDVVELSEGAKLDRFAYTGEDGVASTQKIPDSFHDDGFVEMIIDGLPLELTMLPGNKIEICWPVGMHDHAKARHMYKKP
tara:strand:+ start:4006 stop:4416 length:411 start_codon:yes stop_codon:yes gene_type:complete